MPSRMHRMKNVLEDMMNLLDRLWKCICEGEPSTLACHERIIGGIVYAFKKVSETEITLDVYYGNDHYDFGVVFMSVVNDKEHSPCVTMKYPPKDQYEFIHIQHQLGNLGTSLLGDYKEWSDAEINNWVESMRDEYRKLAYWRIWVSKKFKELESSLLEPDWNIVAAITKEMKEHADLIFKPGHITCQESPEDEREG